MKYIYFDLIGGASGDMLLGSLLDAGLQLSDLEGELDKLKLDEFEIRSRKVEKNGFSATKADVWIEDQVHERHLVDILELIELSDLESDLKFTAKEIFLKIGKVEAEIHQTELENVHLHELGGVDTIVDVVGLLSGLKLMEIDQVHCSRIPLGQGFISGAHGQIPLPAPATAALLKGIPVVGRDLPHELVTPTAAALLSELSDSFGPIPSMTIESIGYGAGTREMKIPNLLRVLVGSQDESESQAIQHLVELKTNIDDQNPEIYQHVIQILLEAGALDASLIPIQMKKNRPGIQVQVLCKPEDSGRLCQILFQETTTLGIRRNQIERISLPRTIIQVNTKYGPVSVKIARIGKGKVKASPEYEDCLKIAREHGLPLQQVIQQVLQFYYAEKTTDHPEA